MFEDFTEETVMGAGADIFLRRAGPADAPALLMLHGNPQTSAMWHIVAPTMAKNFQVVCPDLRGYGRSGKPPSDLEHTPYSKRAMAADMVKVMRDLGHDRFYIAAHDRGARVAHRLALDNPACVIAATLLDIAPTREMYANTNADFAQAYWHWFLQTQRAPIPEDIIGNNPEQFWKLKCFNQAGGNPFAPAALDEYLDAFRDPAMIHASCEDYRAARTIDIDHDNADGRRKLEVPLQILWAKNGAIEKCFEPMNLWQNRASNVIGEAMTCGHYMAEEIPDEIIAKLVSFFGQYPDERTP